MRPLRLGTRASPLARRQTAEAAAVLAGQGVETSSVTISTQGDRDRQTSLLQLGGQGVFTRALEEALVDDRIDVAVHSAKDLPTELLDGTAIVAYLPRADVRDVLVSRRGESLAALNPGARVGTSSRRRAAQLLTRRPDLRVEDVRGNVDTRLRKVERGEYDAIVLAAAGLARMDRLDAVSEYLPINVMLPAPGQGAIALQARADDSETAAALSAANHAPTALAVRAERGVLAALGAGCSLPVAALAHLRGAELTLLAQVLDPAGTQIVTAQRSAAGSDPETLGRAVGEELLAKGADILLREVVS